MVWYLVYLTTSHFKTTKFNMNKLTILQKIELYTVTGITQCGDKMVADLHEIFKKNLEFPILLIQSEYNRDKFDYKYQVHSRDRLEWTMDGCLWLKGLLIRCSELLDSPATAPVPNATNNDEFGEIVIKSTK